MEGKWRLLGQDPFLGEFYRIWTAPESFPTEEAAREAARKFLAENSDWNPCEDAGGQEDDGLQDRVFIVRPDGSKYRYLPVD